MPHENVKQIFILNFECVTKGKICVTDKMFLCSKLYALPHGGSVTRAKKCVTYTITVTLDKMIR